MRAIKYYIPNFLTLLRVGLIPLMLAAFLYLPQPINHYYAGFIFAISAVTDLFDGYLARKYHAVSPLGAFLDPVADKLLVCTSLMIILLSHPSKLIIIATIIIICREITLLALREWMAHVGKSNLMKVLFIAKFKTCTQMVSIVVLMIRYNDLSIMLAEIGFIVATGLTLYSMIEYLQIAAKDLTFFSQQT